MKTKSEIFKEAHQLAKTFEGDYIARLVLALQIIRSSKDMIKTISLEDLAEKLNGKLWEKGNMKRIYLNDYGYNTKKMSTKTYVYAKEDGTFGVSCKIECPSQPYSWIESQENNVIKSLSGTISEIIEEFGYEIENPKIKIQAKLDAEEQVQGYYMRWHEVRVPINRFGKLAIRKRQKVHTYVGPVSKTPDGFIALNDEDFAIAKEKESKETLYEYGNEPNLAGEAKRIEDRKIAREKAEKERKEQLLKEAEEKEKKKAEEKEQLAAKIAELDPSDLQAKLLTWKLEGCNHPCPEEVLAAKQESGLNWRAFVNAIQPIDPEDYAGVKENIAWQKSQL